MKTIKFFAYAFFVAFLSLASCSAEDGIDGEDGIGITGADGTDGEDGQDGEDGTNGTDGQDGENGTDGEDGTNGTDGQDGENGTNGEDGTNGTDGQNGEDGTDGDNGTNGTDGQNGEDGTDGQDGEDGEDGNANVISSDWIPLNVDPTPTNSTLAEVDGTSGVFTQEVRDTYAILVYARFNNTTSSNIVSLEYTTGVEVYTYFVRAAFNSLFYVFRTTDDSDVDLSIVSDLRYVLIPPPTRSSETMNPEAIKAHYISKGVDFSNYEAVKEHFNLR